MIISKNLIDTCRLANVKKLIHIDSIGKRSSLNSSGSVGYRLGIGLAWVY